jgi:pimeloyl-ACP methyl ester carboxylesterase
LFPTWGQKEDIHMRYNILVHVTNISDPCTICVHIYSYVHEQYEEEYFMIKKSYLVPPLVLLLVIGNFTAMGTRTAKASSAVQRSCVLSDETNTRYGKLDGADYIIQVPANWHGTLVFYSHGYVLPGLPNPATDAPSKPTASALLQEGYALAGSSYSQTGWAVQQAFHDDLALLDFFTQTCGHPQRTIVWGSSMGGLITAGLVQLAPQRFAGAVPMCGVLGGDVGFFNQSLDGLFAFNLLLADSSLHLVNSPNPQATLLQAEQILTTAQQTPEGRARIALSSALADTPGWFAPTSPEPAPTDYSTRERNQYLAVQQNFLQSFLVLADVEERAGGNPFWTDGVDYRQQLQQSTESAEVKSLYQQAGLDLQSDLDSLQDASPILVNEQALDYFKQYIIFNGQLSIPVLTMHTTGDTLVPVQDEQAYQSVVDAAGDTSMLRQIYIHRAGHCTFTDAEMLTALHTMVHRLDSGRWGDAIDPFQLNAAAVEFGALYNLVPPAFISYHPGPFLRPYDVRDE